MTTILAGRRSHWNSRRPGKATRLLDPGKQPGTPAGHAVTVDKAAGPSIIRGMSVDQQRVRRTRTGLIAHDPARALQGYTLFAPMFGDGTVYLVDMDGTTVHTWRLLHAGGDRARAPRLTAARDRRPP